MNYYETLYIIHPSLESGRLKDIILGVEESLKNVAGKPIGLELWGKRKLSYFIDKQKYGTYVLLQFSGKGLCSREFSRELELNPNILAYLTTSIDKDNIMKDSIDLDVQIAGKSREDERSGSTSNLEAEKLPEAEVAREMEEAPEAEAVPDNNNLDKSDEKSAVKEEE